MIRVAAVNEEGRRGSNRQSSSGLTPTRPSALQLRNVQTAMGLWTAINGPEVTQPKAAFDALAQARRGLPSAETCLRPDTDKLDSHGKVMLRRGPLVLYIGIGRRHAGIRIRFDVTGLEFGVVTRHGELLRHLTLGNCTEVSSLRQVLRRCGHPVALVESGHAVEKG